MLLALEGMPAIAQLPEIRLAIGHICDPFLLPRLPAFGSSRGGVELVEEGMVSVVAPLYRIPESVAARHLLSEILERDSARFPQDS
jgi:hypothetical protein